MNVGEDVQPSRNLRAGDQLRSTDDYSAAD